MTERQFERLRANRARVLARPALATGAVGGLLRRAVRESARKERVRASLEGLLPAAWLGLVEVVCVRGEEVWLAASDRRVGAELRRRQGWLSERLSAVVPGVRRVRIGPARVQSGADDAR